MKLLKKICLILCVALAVSAFAGCNRDTVVSEDDMVIIHANNEFMEITYTTTLLDYMNALSDAGELTFTISDGMITSVNGKENFMSSYWMIYTDDTEKWDESWGKITYNDKEYLSASFGAGDLVIKDGCTYILAYQSF